VRRGCWLLAQEGYAAQMAAYAAAHPKAPRTRRAPRPAGALRRPTSAYIHFLAAFRAAFKAREDSSSCLSSHCLLRGSVQGA
jgi:hypothetical protein